MSVEVINCSIVIPFLLPTGAPIHVSSGVSPGYLDGFRVIIDSTVEIFLHLPGSTSVEIVFCAVWIPFESIRVISNGPVCIACRLEYPIANEVWDFIGACAPIPIHSSLDAESVVIERSMLLKAARYF